MISTMGNNLMPRRATKHSAGYDFKMPCETTIEPGQTVVIDSGICLEEGDLNIDEVMLLLPRSSLGIKYGLRLKNTVGVIDADYRDTIKIALVTDKKLTLIRGEKVMQGVIVKFGLIPQEIKPEAERKGGLGSTGKL